MVRVTKIIWEGWRIKKLYIQQKITIGKAAQIADVTRFQFETLLSEYKIPISNLDMEDVLGDIEKLK
jgi:predicted HTH domain antitoxin